MVNEVIRILILGNRESDADQLECKFINSGLAVPSKWARNEEEFLRDLEEFSPDLILSDYNFIQYTGELALAAAKKRFPEVPFIFVSDTLDKDDERLGEILASDANGYIFKDELDQLSPAIYGALGFGSWV